MLASPTVPVGQMLAAQTRYRQGTVTVTEGAEGAVLLSTGSPPRSPAICAWQRLTWTTQERTVTVTAGSDTTVNFMNDTNVNEIKVCKVLSSNNQGALAEGDYLLVQRRLGSSRRQLGASSTPITGDGASGIRDGSGSSPGQRLLSLPDPSLKTGSRSARR